MNAGQSDASNSVNLNTVDTAEINYRTIIIQSPNAIFITNPLGKLLIVNDSTVRLTGFTEEELLQMSYFDFLVKEKVEKEPLHVIELGKGKTVVTEREMKLKDGKSIDVEITAKLLSSGNMLAFVKNITESKKSRQLLIENEQRLVRAERMGNMGHGFYDLINQRMNISEGLYRIFGKTPESFSHTVEGLRKTIHPDDYKIMGEAVYSLMTEGIVEVEFRILQPNGNIRNVLFKTELTINEKDEPQNCFTTAIDITEQKKANAEKQSLLLRNEQTINTMLDGFILTDASGKIIQVNPAYIKMTGYSKIELLKKNIQDIEITSGKKRKISKGKPVKYETRHRKKNNGLIDLEVSESIMQSEDGQLTASFVIDITEKKKAQQQVEDYNKKLQQLTNHLQTVREEERRRIGREIHDDLGQQLTAIKMDVAWIDKKTPADAILLKQKIDNIITLLDGSNLSVRRILHELKPSILDEYGLPDAIELLGHQFSANTGIPFAITINRKVTGLSEETSTCIFRVVQESLTNITKYAEAKNVLIAIRIGRHKISATIEDDGVGFEPVALQGKNSFGIMGIQERVKALDGYFNIKSIVSKGTVVKVILPVHNKLQPA